MADVKGAVSALKAGGVIAYPTEAVFGLGCDPTNNKALQRIIDIKGRDAHKGFILIASSQSQLDDFLAPVSLQQQHRLDQHWPGPVTFVMPANEAYSDSLLSGYRDTLAVRVSAHPTVVRLCGEFGMPLVSTSANASGEPALRSANSVHVSMGHMLDAIVYGSVGTLETPTQIIDIDTGERLR